MKNNFPCQLVIALLSYGVCSIAFGSNSGALVDLSRPPDYQRLARVTNPEELIGLRDSLGDMLLQSWRPSESGRPGSTGQLNFAAWVDMYQWLDILETHEPEYMRQWLPRHLHVEENQGISPPFRIGIIQSGTSLSHDPLPTELLTKLITDDYFLKSVTDELVSQPFTPEKGYLCDRLDPKFVAATLSNPEFLKIWSESYTLDDFAPKALLNLQSIWKSNPADWNEFLSLALALALVKDEQPPGFWPHSQVAQSEVPRCDLPPDTLFSQWVQAFRMGKLRMDPRQLGVGELKFVVDAPLDPAEIDWVRNNPSISHQDPETAFESINYDQGRVIKEVYVWPWGKYLLSGIREHGGICVDQAYYASICGKAVGIPTIFFSGQGRDGGHAWVGYLKAPGRWDLNVARYAEENYATGEALDPQSWSPITDHDLDLLSRHLGNRDPQDAARRELAIASDFRRKGDIKAEGQALESALQECPENPSLWDAKEEWLERSGATVAALKAHHEAALAQFVRFSDLKAQHEQALIRLEIQSGEKANAAELSEKIVHENQGGWNHAARTDLSAAAAWSLIAERIQAKDGDGAIQEYEHQLQLLGDQGGGNFFYGVVAPFASQLITLGRPDLSLRVLKEANTKLKPTKGSLIDRDLHRLWKEAGGLP